MVVEKNGLIAPYGGELVNLLTPRRKLVERTAFANGLPYVQVSARTVCDLELLAVGAFSPLRGFMNHRDYHSVLDTMRLADGTLFPMPITLPIDPANGDIKPGMDIALRDSRNNILAIQTVEEMYEWNLEEAAVKVFGKYDARHPIVAEMHRWGKVNLAGRLEVLQLPPRLDFAELRRTPAETRAALENYGHQNVVAFQTRNPLHRVHEALTKRAAANIDGVLLLHPVVGMTQPGDVDHYTPRAGLQDIDRQLLRGKPQPAFASAVGDAHGRPARSGLACDHPTQLWRQPSHRRPATTPARVPILTEIPFTVPTTRKIWC